MGDLISRKALIEALSKSHNHHANNSREESLLIRDIAIVKEQPTAYDIEKVVERLEKSAHVEIVGLFNEYEYLYLEEAIEIVKGGAE